MVYAFEADSPVLWMNPRVPPSAVGRTHILWPAWAYTVLAPRVAPRPDDRLDVFQEAILRLLRAEVRNEVEIASLLHLDRKLVAYIKAGLREFHLCDDRGVPTDRGLRALRDADPEQGELCKGFVFQDPNSRVLWARFVEEFMVQEVEWRGETPILMFGSAGSPRPAKSLAVPPPQTVAPMTPRASEILDAVRRHRRLVQAGSEEALVVPGAAEPENIQRITVVSEDPTPVWLGTLLYASDYEEEDAAWNVTDPFGYGSSPLLRAEVARRAEGFEPLRDAIRRLIKPKHVTERRADHAQRVELARMELQERFGVELASYRDLETRLTDLIVAVERAGEDSDAAGRADAMVRAQLALEEALRRTLPDPCDDSIALDLIDDLDYDAKILDARAVALGFESLARGLRFVHAAKIRSALRRRAGSLRPLALANLLAAVTDAGHVLHACARQNPSLLNDLDSIAALRDRSAHAGGEPPSQDELESVGDQVLTIAALLFDLPEKATQEAAHG